MCRFHSLCVYEQPIMKQLEYTWRLDDDSLILSNINQDLFRFMSDKDLVYGYISVTKYAGRCVQHLWNNATSYIRENHIKTQLFNKWPDTKMYYNFEVSATKLWYSAKYKQYINMIDHAGGIYYNRWGDAPIKSIAVSMFVSENKTHCFCQVQASGKTQGSLASQLSPFTCIFSGIYIFIFIFFVQKRTCTYCALHFIIMFNA